MGTTQKQARQIVLALHQMHAASSEEWEMMKLWLAETNNKGISRLNSVGKTIFSSRRN